MTLAPANRHRLGGGRWWQSLATKPIDQPIDLAARSDTIGCPQTAPREIPTTSRPASCYARRLRAEVRICARRPPSEARRPDLERRHRVRQRHVMLPR
jgi:hypothetical protein